MGLLSPLMRLVGVEKSPERTVVPLDESTKQMIQDATQEGFKDEDYFKQQQLSGVPEDFRSTQQSPEQFKAQEESGFAMNPFISQAIHQKYQQEAANELDRIKTQSDYQGKLMKAYELRRGMGLALAQNNVAIRNMQALAQAKMDAERMRAQVLSSLFSAGGNVMGMYAQKKWGGGGVSNTNVTNNGSSGWDSWANPEPLPHEMQWQQQQNLAALAPGQSNIGEF